MTSQQRGLDRLNRAIATYLEQAIKPKPIEQVGYYEGYSADTGLHQVRLRSGKLLSGKLQTTGEPKLGGVVSVQQQADGVNLFDAMPR